MFARYLGHSTYEIDLSQSFRILICSEYQRNLFLLITIEERLRAPNGYVKGECFTINANS